MSGKTEWTDSGLCRYAPRFRALAVKGAIAAGEVPVGAVLGFARAEIAGEGCNYSNCRVTIRPRMLKSRRTSPSCRSNQKLSGCPDPPLYVTLEPCAMCAGAIVAARVQRLMFRRPRYPFRRRAEVIFRIADSDLQNHRVRVEEGLLGLRGRRTSVDRFSSNSAADNKKNGRNRFHQTGSGLSQKRLRFSPT